MLRMRRFGTRAHEEAGASAIEYAFLAALIAVVIVGVVESVGLSLIPGFQDVINGI